jgi:hypothetical protein
MADGIGVDGAHDSQMAKESRRLGMYHTIEFLGDCLLDLETSPRDRLQRTLISRGDRLVL